MAKGLIQIIPITFILILWMPNLSFLVYYSIIFLVAFLIISANFKYSFQLERNTIYFAGVFLIICFLSSFTTWKSNFDIKDVFAVLTFFVIVPNYIRLLLGFNKNYLKYLVNSIDKCFYVFVLLIIGYALFFGITLMKNAIFGIQKNGIALIFEPLFIFFLYHKKYKNKFKSIFITIVGLLAMLAIGSKTSLLLMALFALPLFSIKTFKIIIVFVSIIVLFLLVYFLNNIQLLETIIMRFSLWGRAYQDIFSSTSVFLFGSGPGTFIMDWDVPGVYMKDSIHNYFLQYIHGFGIISFMFFIYMFFKSYVKLNKVFISPSQTAILVFFIHSFLDVGWVKGQGFFVSIIMGIALYENSKKRDEKGIY